MSQLSRNENRRNSPRRQPKRTSRALCVTGKFGLGPNVAVALLDVSETGIRLVLKTALVPGHDVEVGLEAIGDCGEPVAADLVRLHRRVTGLLASDWYDTTDLRRAAAAVLRREPRRGREIGEVVLFLPQELAPSATALLRELPAGGIRVVAGRTGEERADAGVVETVRAWERVTVMFPWWRR